MRKFTVFIAFIILTLLVTGCSASAKRYEESMEAALEQMEDGYLEKAKASLVAALAEKPKDEKANAYLEQIEAIVAGEEALEAGELEKAKKHTKRAVTMEGGSDSLVQYAENLLTKVDSVKKAHEAVLNMIEAAEQLLAAKDYSGATEILDKFAKFELTNPVFSKEFDKVTALQIEVQEAKEAEETRLKVEKEQQEKARLAMEKEEQERLAKEKAKAEKQEGVGPFKGYWLKDTMACHITDTYMACALAESDFITNDKIISSKLINDSEVEITYEGDSKVTLHLRDQNSLELADGIYKRVSAEEANAIYGGYYTLP